MKKIFLLLLLVSVSGFSQTVNPLESVNDYKYAIVPARFPFFKQADEYKLNTYTKMFMEKYGFTVFFDTDKFPVEVASQNCNKLYVEVIEEKTMFITRLTVVLKDCRNNVMFTSATGRSKEKDYKTAYTKALREAFDSFGGLNYKYNGKNDNAKVPAKIEETAVFSADFEKPASSNPVNDSNDAVSAQPIPNGFQLVDTTPKIVLKIYRTSSPDIYIASNDTAKGVFIRKTGQWFFEYYENNKLFSQPVNVKF